MEKTQILERIGELRKSMNENGITYCIIPTTDFHQSEYVSDYFKVREYFSGFTGSNGTLVVSQTKSGLWTDGRYFVQAKTELEGSDITLFPMEEKGVPTILEYLLQNCKEGDCVAFDGRVIDAEYGLTLEKELSLKNVTISYTEDVAGNVWKTRPVLSGGEIRVLPETLCGESAAAKISRLRREMKRKKAEYFMLSKLDDIMWLYNIRGEDIAYNPAALSYTFVTMTQCYLFLHEKAVTEDLGMHCFNNRIVIQKYSDAVRFLQEYSYAGEVWADKKNSSYTIYKLLQDKTKIITDQNPTEQMKAVKNNREIENMLEIYRKDSAALVKFIFWLKKNIGKQEITELSAAKYLDKLRSEIKEFLDLSFPTISAYNENAAMMHYSVNEESNRTLEKRGSLLIDSGGQYNGGTTDVTRTIILGETKEAFKKHYTAVVSGMLQLQSAVFLQGCTGRNLDILARQPLWDMQMDYKCGTGHGIGYMLNVHEGPQGIRYRYSKKTEEAVLEAGMVTSDEPGVYLEGKYGIRIENILLCKNKAENEEGNFLCFEPLTYVPIDLEGIDSAYLSQENRRRFNSYHQKVFLTISPYLNAEEKEWLRAETREI